MFFKKKKKECAMTKVVNLSNLFAQREIMKLMIQRESEGNDSITIKELKNIMTTTFSRAMILVKGGVCCVDDIIE